MSGDLLDLPDLTGEVTHRTVAPPYDAVSRRVRARRLRGAAGSLAVAVLVVGGVAVWQGSSTTGAQHPDPAGPSQGPIPRTDERLWRAVVDGPQSHVFVASGAADGSVAILWRALEQPEPTFALVIRNPDGTLSGRRLDAPVSLTPVPGGWVGVDGSRGWFISTDGSWRALGRPVSTRIAKPGDVLVAGAHGRWVYSSEDGDWSVLSPVPGDPDALHVTSDGHVVSCAGRSGAVRLARDGSPVQETPGDACVVAGVGDHVVVAAVADAADGSVPVVRVLRSDDGGLTWSSVPVVPGSLTSVDVLTDGTPVVSTDGGGLTLGDAQYPATTGEERGMAFAAGQRVYTLAYGQDHGPISFTDDAGASWLTEPLPGMESSPG